MRHLVLAILFIVLSPLCAIADEEHSYVVQKGDTLSSIAKKLIGGPIYAKDGALSKILSMNPHIVEKDLIFPGKTLSFKTPENGLRFPSAEETQPAPETPAAETPSTEKNLSAPAEEFKQVSRFEVSYGYRFSRLDAKDKATGANSTFLSNLAPLTTIAWNLDWSERWTTRLEFSDANEKFLDDVATPARTIESAGHRRRFGMNGTHHWSAHQRSSFGIGFQEGYFARSTSLTSISLDTVSSGFLRFSHELDLFVLKNASFVAAAGIEGIQPGQGTGYTTNAGSAYDLNLILRHRIKQIVLEGRAYYEQAVQHSTLVEQKEKLVGGSLGLIWEFGE